MKKRVVIWGGNGKPLSLETLDSHASVNAFFLTKYLTKYFNIINITDIDNPEEILKYDNIHSVIATSQYGFTNRIIGKAKYELFDKIRKHVKGKLCSIADNNNIGKYYEDTLFCVRPVSKNNLVKLRRLNENPNLEVHRSGWCAEPDVFYPIKIDKDEFNIFIDHAPYSLKSTNYIEKYYNALSKLIKNNKDKKITVYHQNDFGIVKWDFTNDLNLKTIYNRSIKVPYLSIAEVYRKIHIFCFTHKESAGLSGIEAAMCGAKLYIPTDILGRSFIKKDLLNKNINYKIFYPNNYILDRQFHKDICLGINKKLNHEKLKFSSNTWENASKIISKVINGDD
jgi:hypothetical protein